MISCCRVKWLYLSKTVGQVVEPFFREVLFHFTPDVLGCFLKMCSSSHLRHNASKAFLIGLQRKAKQEAEEHVKVSIRALQGPIDCTLVHIEQGCFEYP